MSRVNYLTLVQLNSLRTLLQPVADIWGTPYLVGSCLDRPNFRDVDIRLILPDRKIARAFRPLGSLLLTNHVYSAWIGAMTGLPVDFQFQPKSESTEYDGHAREPLSDAGMTWRSIDERHRKVSTTPETKGAPDDHQ